MRIGAPNNCSSFFSNAVLNRIHHAAIICSNYELFSFENPPLRPSYPEVAGLRYLAFELDDVAHYKAD